MAACDTDEVDATAPVFATQEYLDEGVDTRAEKKRKKKNKKEKKRKKKKNKRKTHRIQKVGRARPCVGGHCGMLTSSLAMGRPWQPVKATNTSKCAHCTTLSPRMTAISVSIGAMCV